MKVKFLLRCTMLFNSFNFLVFFILVSVFYFVIPHKVRWILLLASSYYFYMCWKPELIILIVFSTFMNYIVSLMIYREKSLDKRKKYLIISLLINFGLLFIFKYLVFINQSIMSIFTTFGADYPFSTFDIILPMGISFYTFQAASYTIDVYRKKIKPVRNYGIFSLYITFFPQLVAGPIERSENLLPQFYKKHNFDLERIVMGIKIMIYGFFKKIVIADRISVAVNTIFNNPTGYSGLYFVLASFLFSFQIYCDFSGYSDIAVGAAKVLGFDLMANFKTPFLSKSIREFWSRWHISLSSWFSDYVYIPLGGSRCSKIKHYRNIFITFLVSGLWHGANFTYIIWGGLHGIFQIMGSITQNARNKFKELIGIKDTKLAGFISIIITFSLFSFSLIFFRANTISEALYIIKNLFYRFSHWGTPQYLYEVVTGLGINLVELIVIFSAIVILMTFEILSGKNQVYDYIEKKNIVFRFMFYILITTIVLTVGVYYNAGEFIYFQF